MFRVRVKPMHSSLHLKSKMYGIVFIPIRKRTYDQSDQIDTNSSSLLGIGPIPKINK